MEHSSWAEIAAEILNSTVFSRRRPPRSPWAPRCTRSTSTGLPSAQSQRHAELVVLLRPLKPPSSGARSVGGSVGPPPGVSPGANRRPVLEPPPAVRYVFRVVRENPFDSNIVSGSMARPPPSWDRSPSHRGGGERNEHLRISDERLTSVLGTLEVANITVGVNTTGGTEVSGPYQVDIYASSGKAKLATGSAWTVPPLTPFHLRRTAPSRSHIHAGRRCIPVDRGSARGHEPFENPVWGQPVRPAGGVRGRGNRGVRRSGRVPPPGSEGRSVTTDYGLPPSVESLPVLGRVRWATRTLSSSPW